MGPAALPVFSREKVGIAEFSGGSPRVAETPCGPARICERLCCRGEIARICISCGLRPSGLVPRRTVHGRLTGRGALGMPASTMAPNRCLLGGATPRVRGSCDVNTEGQLRPRCPLLFRCPQFPKKVLLFRGAGARPVTSASVGMVQLARLLRTDRVTTFNPRPASLKCPSEITTLRQNV